jgi:hypothetical protein
MPMLMLMLAPALQNAVPPGQHDVFVLSLLRFEVPRMDSVQMAPRMRQRAVRLFLGFTGGYSTASLDAALDFTG